MTKGLLSGAFTTYKHFARDLAMMFSTALVILMGCAIKGDVVFMMLLAYKGYISNLHDLLIPTHEKAGNNSALDNATITFERSTPAYQPVLPDYLQVFPDLYNMKDYLLYLFIGTASSLVIMHLVAGFLQVYYYTLQRGNPEAWKCQPHRFLTRSNEIHEIVVGTINMTIGGLISGSVTCWIANGNFNTIYYKIDEYGYPYFFASFGIYFLWIEAAAYYIHAWLHRPFIYRTLHKHHHRYHTPTAYSVVALSPIELLIQQSYIIAPVFLVPINAIAVITVVLYIYYFGLIDHSGVKMESWLPWKPSSMFHDDHHRYFHCNFGLNTALFDWLHGTTRQKNRLYNETIFGGKGSSKED